MAILYTSHTNICLNVSKVNQLKGKKNDKVFIILIKINSEMKRYDFLCDKKEVFLKEKKYISEKKKKLVWMKFFLLYFMYGYEVMCTFFSLYCLMIPTSGPA